MEGLCDVPNFDVVQASTSILIVDDMELHLETARIYLEKAGYKVFIAADSEAAWLVVTEYEPDIILLDVVMPGESGLDFLSRVMSDYPDTGVIVMTSFGSEDVAAAAFKLGALDYIRKPLKYSSLRDIVQKVIKKQRQVKSQKVDYKILQQAFEDLQVSADSILQCMSSGVIAVDNKLRIRIINQKARELLQVGEQDVTGLDFYDIFPVFTNISLLKTAIDTGQGARLQKVEVTVAGEKRFLNINTGVIYDLSGNKAGAVGVFDDITELIKKEELLREREKLAVIGQMAAGMAHELKNPLTSIRGFAQLLAGRAIDSTLDEYLRIVISEIDRMNQVIQDFLQLARPRPMELVRMSVNDLVEEISPIIEPQAFLKKIDVNIETDDNIPKSMVDPAHIKQVLLNLAQNSMEAMEGGGILGIKTIYHAGVSEVRLDISDTGDGISPDSLKKIGVPFFTTKPGGTGLGLSISFNIIEQHRGRIEIQSREGMGTTFSVLLPV